MKIRDGHVSNSSSSSFHLVCTPEVYDKAMAKAKNDFMVFIAKQIKEKFTTTMGGQNIIIVNEMMIDGGPYMTEELESPEPIVTQKRGCKHDVAKSHEFCPKCGKPRIIEEVEESDDSPGKAWYDFKAILQEMKNKGEKDLLIERHDF